MLKLHLNSILFLILPITGVAQLTFNVDTVSFPPTTVDSTRVFSLMLTNDLVVEQVVTFSGVDESFGMETDSLIVPAEGAANVEVYFTPNTVNTFTMNLNAIGNVFGSDSVHVMGEGTLPQAEFLTDTINFIPTAINNYSTEYLPIVNVGVGALFIDSIVSSDQVISAPQGIVIAEGDTAQIPITFYSQLTGIYNVDLAIYTNDPVNPIRNVHCTASAISEVGGHVCGTWSLVNSPYLLIEHVIVPDSCTLTIEPGVVILGDSLDIEVFGALFANGTAELPIYMTVGELLSHTAAEI